MAKQDVPAWARGLDMSESRKLAKRLSLTEDQHQELVRKKDAALRRPRFSAKLEDSSRGLFVYVTPPGVAYSNAEKCAQMLWEAGLKLDDVAPYHVHLTTAANGGDHDDLRVRVHAALAARDVRVTEVK